MPLEAADKTIIYSAGQTSVNLVDVDLLVSYSLLGLY